MTTLSTKYQRELRWLNCRREHGTRDDRRHPGSSNLVERILPRRAAQDRIVSERRSQRQSLKHNLHGCSLTDAACHMYGAALEVIATAPSIVVELAGKMSSEDVLSHSWVSTASRTVELADEAPPETVQSRSWVTNKGEQAEAHYGSNGAVLVFSSASTGAKGKQQRKYAHVAFVAND